MSDLRATFMAQNDPNNIKTKWPVFDLVGFQEVLGRPNEPDAFLWRNRLVRLGEAFVGPCPDLHKDNCAVIIGCNQINLAQFPGEVAGDCRKAFAFQKPLTPLLAPPAKEFAVL